MTNFSLFPARLPFVFIAEASTVSYPIPGFVLMVASESRRSSVAGNRTGFVRAEVRLSVIATASRNHVINRESRLVSAST